MKFKIILLRDECPALEQAINERLQKDPSYLNNLTDHCNQFNKKMEIENNWQGLTFIAVKPKANIHKLQHTDILAYLNTSISRPQGNIQNISLISFCDNMNLICAISSEVMERLHNSHGINIINFTAREEAIIYRLFNLAMNNQKLTDKFFSNWSGRYIGYQTNNGTDMAGKVYNRHLFEVIRKQNL